MTAQPKEPADTVAPSATLPPAQFQPGTEIPPLHVGPLSLVDLVRWTAYQENWLRLHYDREYAMERRGLPGVVQSGHHRTALIARMLTDWLGEGGDLRRLQVRHTGMVRPGDAIACRGRISRLAKVSNGVEVTLEVWAIRQDGAVVSEGQAVGYVSRANGATR